MVSVVTSDRVGREDATTMTAFDGAAIGGVCGWTGHGWIPITGRPRAPAVPRPGWSRPRVTAATRECQLRALLNRGEPGARRADGKKSIRTRAGRVALAAVSCSSSCRSPVTASTTRCHSAKLVAYQHAFSATEQPWPTCAMQNSSSSTTPVHSHLPDGVPGGDGAAVYSAGRPGQTITRPHRRRTAAEAFRFRPTSSCNSDISLYDIFWLEHSCQPLVRWPLRKIRRLRDPDEESR